jgi:hypothetical protein
LIIDERRSAEVLPPELESELGSTFGAIVNSFELLAVSVQPAKSFADMIVDPGERKSAS